MTGPQPTATAPSSTPTVRQAVRRGVFWAVLAVIAVAFTALTIVVAGGGRTPEAPLSPDDPAPAGAQGLVRVLEAHGITVRTPSNAEEAADDLADGDTTLLLADPNHFLDPQRTLALVDAADTSLLVQPGAAVLEALPGSPRAVHDGDERSTSEAGCRLPAAERAGEIYASGPSYRAADPWRSCFRGPDGGARLITDPQRGVSVLGAGEVLSNEGITSSGNAALAIGLLGGHDTLVWYLPGVADLGAAAPTDLGTLTPGWVTPAIVLLACAAAAAIVWRGRRFGPLVVEDLPVVVRAGETREGRSRLYARTSARRHALDQLRMGALTRLAELTGLGRDAGVDAVVAAVAARTGTDPVSVRGTLVDDIPDSDRDLVAAAERLASLERTTARAVGREPGGRHGHPPERGRP